MQVIAVLNQKGGAGKTTIATHLARALQLDGADVLLLIPTRRAAPAIGPPSARINPCPWLASTGPPSSAI
jgi:MoxR-like ATPase